MSAPPLANERAKMLHNSRCVVFPCLQLFSILTPSETYSKFEDLAIGVLNMCKAASSSKTFRMLHQKVDMFSDGARSRNTIDVAYESDNIRFLSQPATQMVVHNDWFGGMQTISWKQLMMSFILIVPVSWLVKHADLSQVQ